LSEPDYQKLKTALHTLAGLAAPTRTTEKTKAVFPETENASSSEDKTTEKKPRPAGHGRNGAAVFTGAKKVVIPHPSLKTGDACPSCQQGKVYGQQAGTDRWASAALGDDLRM
jgi:transposase